MNIRHVYDIAIYEDNFTLFQAFEYRIEVDMADYCILPTQWVKVLHADGGYKTHQQAYEAAKKWIENNVDSTKYVEGTPQTFSSDGWKIRPTPKWVAENDCTTNAEKYNQMKEQTPQYNTRFATEEEVVKACEALGWKYEKVMRAPRNENFIINIYPTEGQYDWEHEYYVYYSGQNIDWVSSVDEDGNEWMDSYFAMLLLQEIHRQRTEELREALIDYQHLSKGLESALSEKLRPLDDLLNELK